MSKPLDFSDVVLALLPEGSVWAPSDTPVLVATQTQNGPVFAPGSPASIIAAVSWAPLSPRAGDQIVVTGSIANDGIWVVAADWSISNPMVIYVEGKLIFEAVVADRVFERRRVGGPFKRTVLACGDNHQAVRDFLKTLAYLRDPQNTPILSDLEKEYGLITNTGLTAQQRRDQLYAIVYAPAGTGAASYLQAQLQAGGFSAYVYQNSLTTDPGAFYGGPGGELITNSEAYDRTIEGARHDQNLWPFVFFVGGTAYRDSDGKVVHIEPLVISDALRPAFRRIVLQCKPVHAWALAVINAESYFTFSDNDTFPLSDSMGFADTDAYLSATAGGYWYEEGDDWGWVQVLLDATGAVVIDDATGAVVIDG